MKSHEYQFTARDFLSLSALPLTVCVVFSAIMLAGSKAALGFLPSPKPILDVDRTILIHQAEASRNVSSAEILLIGDSSCLMNVNARQLEQLSGKRVLNLGTLSHISLQEHTRLLSHYLSNNPSVTTVVLLMHPETLRLSSPALYFNEVFRSYFAGIDQLVPGESLFLRLTGVYPFRARLLTRYLPIALPAEYGRYYGFNQNLWNYLTKNSGSAIDPHTYPTTPPTGNPEYRLAPRLESAARSFGAGLPHQVHVMVGITPSPGDYAFRNHAENCRAMLGTWSQWLDADTALTNLPFVLPRTHFATTTHLNPGGVSEYTQLLAGQITSLAP